MSKPRVLIFHPALAPYRVDLFNELTEQCQLKIVFLQKNLLSQKFDQVNLIRQLHVDHTFLTKGITVGGRSIRFGIIQIIKEFQPNIIITHEYSPVSLAVTVLKKTLRMKCHHIIWSADNPVVVENENFIRGHIRKRALPFIDGLILYTNETAELYRQKFNFVKPIGVVPNIPKEKSFRSMLEMSKDIVAKLIESHKLTGQKVILFVGRLSREKCIERVINVFGGFDHHFDNVRLILVGDGAERVYLEQLVKKQHLQKKILFTGRLEGKNLYAWYRIGGIFVLPSEFEPFGAVVNEALLSGMPVICSDKAGARILIKKGYNGAVVNASDSQELSTVLKELIEECPPISMDITEELRPSLMPIKFDNVVEAFITLLTTVTHNNRHKEQL